MADLIAALNPYPTSMTTIHPLGLAFTIATQGAVELIDVRPRAEFSFAHIRDARSIPLRKLQAAKIVRERGLTNPKPLFLICNGKTRAGLAAGMLRAAGCLEPVVVEGGMELWEANGLPVMRPWQFPAIKNFADATRARLQSLVGSGNKVAGEIAQPLSQRANDDWWCGEELQEREANRA